MEEGRNPDRNSGWGMWVVEMEFSSGNVGASRQGRGRCLAEGKERRGSALEICESQLGCLLQACLLVTYRKYISILKFQRHSLKERLNSS